MTQHSKYERTLLSGDDERDNAVTYILIYMYIR